MLPWPVDYRTSGEEGIGVMRDNPADSLQTTTMAIREWIGLIAYKFAGRIDSVFPGPEDVSGLVARTALRAAEKNCRRTRTQSSSRVDRAKTSGPTNHPR